MTQPVSHDVFVSFSSLDSANAVAVCQRLEAEGLICWISLRDVRPGENYQAAIVQAIQSAKIMVLIFSANANLSAEISKELSLASAFKVHVIPMRTANVLPQGAFLYELATRQWIDAFDGWEAALDNLVSTVKRVLGGVQAAEPSTVKVISPPPAPTPAPALRAEMPKMSEGEMEETRLALAQFVGPIAKLMVRKAASAAASADEFHNILARNLNSDEERRLFLARVRDASRARSR